MLNIIIFIIFIDVFLGLILNASYRLGKVLFFSIFQVWHKYYKSRNKSLGNPSKILKNYVLYLPTYYMTSGLRSWNGQNNLFKITDFPKCIDQNLNVYT